MISSLSNINGKYLFRKLVFEYGFLVGSNSQLTSPKMTQYILGTRDTVEIFKLYELRYLLLKMYPLIHLLFQNPRTNPRLKVKLKKLVTRQGPATEKYAAKTITFRPKKTILSYAYKNSPPQILFATITEAFAEIIAEAAKVCHMPHHEKRGTNGFITAAISDLYRHNPGDYRASLAQKETATFAAQNGSLNKEDSEQTKEKSQHFRYSRGPSLVVIPDPSNNDMILSEIKKIGLPVIGLVSSDSSLEIDYPLFAHDQSYTSVYFFCHFLASLIAKEMAYTQHKHYILQKPSISKKKSWFKPRVLPYILKNFFFFRSFLRPKNKFRKRCRAQNKFQHWKFRFKNKKWVKKGIAKQVGKKGAKKGINIPKMIEDLRHTLNSLPDEEDYGKYYRGYGVSNLELLKNDYTTNNYRWQKEIQNKYHTFRPSKSRVMILLHNFLGMFKQITFHGKTQIFTNKNIGWQNRRYYGYVVQFLSTDGKGQNHEFLLRKLLRIPTRYPKELKGGRIGNKRQGKSSFRIRYGLSPKAKGLKKQMKITARNEKDKHWKKGFLFQKRKPSNQRIPKMKKGTAGKHKSFQK